MRSWILVAVILQLVFTGTETDGKYQFGDIIEFPRKCIGKYCAYSHFAVYVGGDPKEDGWRDVGQGDSDIFHRSGKVGKTICTFGELAETRQGSEDRENNYLDDSIPAEYRSPDKIQERIFEKKNECGKYGVLKNNCEHLATYVRYGDPQSRQKGTVAGWVSKREINNTKLEEIKARIDEVIKRDLDMIQETDENNNTLCTSDAHKPVTWQPVLSACFVLLFFLLGGSCVCCFVKCFSIKSRREYSRV